MLADPHGGSPTRGFGHADQTASLAPACASTSADCALLIALVSVLLLTRCSWKSTTPDSITVQAGAVFTVRPSTEVSTRQPPGVDSRRGRSGACTHVRECRSLDAH